jgi:hypothetical protein
MHYPHALHTVLLFAVLFRRGIVLGKGQVEIK